MFHFGGSEPRRLAGDFPKMIESLRDIGHVVDAIEFFVEFCAKCFLQGTPAAAQTPLAKGERF